MNVIEYIDGRIEQGISHPDQLAGTPEELESKLWAFDEVRNFLVSFNDPSKKFKSYPDYLMTTECAAATYCFRKRWNNETPTLDGLAAFWRQFLQWRDS